MKKIRITGRDTLSVWNKLIRVMKLTMLFLMIGLMQVSASLYSQSTRLTLDMKDSRVVDILEEIEEQSEFRFAYSTEFIDMDRKITIHINKRNIEETLHTIFSGTNIKYSLNDRHILLYPSEMENERVKGLQKAISGKVTDQSSSPLPGVTVVIKGTTQGTITDADGNYSLSNVSEDAILVFSFVGMKMQEIPVGGKNTINVTIAEDAIGIEEVVAIGYGTMKKSDLTGAVISANIEAFHESQNVNILESLHGSVPGLQIGQTNRAGQDVSIQIRGVNTLSGNRDPLIVVDEVIYSGRISDLNPSDIKSVNILKDASSKAIYGSQAANGVMLITTKSGKKNEKPTFSYSGSVSFRSPTVKARLLNREELLEKVKGICYTKAYLAPDYTEPNPGWAWGQSELVPNLLQGIEDGTDYDWWDALTSPGFTENHVLTMKGGTEKTSYYMSGGYTNDDGFVLNDNYKRYTTRINFTNEIKNWLTLGINTFGSFTDLSGQSPNYTEISFTSPLVTPYDENGNLVIYPKGASTTNLNPFLHPSADDKNVSNQISGIFYIDVKIPKVEGLTYRINYNQSLDWRNFANSNEYGAGLTGSVRKQHISKHQSTLDNIISYKKQWNHHRINATLVYGYQKTEYAETKADGENIANINLSYNSIQQAITQRISSNAWEEASLYQMTRIVYNYKDRYLVTGTLRRDGFSGFAKNNKFGYFPSVALGWVLSNEPFFNIPKLNYLKLRASYGQNGNQTSIYSSIAKVSAVRDFQYVFGDGASTSPGEAVTALANNDLSWEKTSGLNFGIDFGILNNKVRGNIEYYSTTTTSLLWNMVIPKVTGFSSIQTNIGEVANSGFEFSVQATPFNTGKISWDIATTFSANDNKVVHLLGTDNDDDGNEDDLISSDLFIGKSIGTIYSYEIDGIYQINDDIPTGYNPGNYRIIDQNDDGKITAADDRVFLGRKEPAYSFGIQNSFNYKNFTLRFFINSIQGGKDGYLGSQAPSGVSLGSTGNFTNTNSFNFFDFWSVTNPDAKYAVTYQAPQISGTKYCSRSFVRLQDISLAYQLNKSILQKLGIKSTKLYISGKNLLTFTNWEGWDPETGQGVGGQNAYPVMKSVNLGIDVIF